MIVKKCKYIKEDLPTLKVKKCKYLNEGADTDKAINLLKKYKTNNNWVSTSSRNEKNFLLNYVRNTLKNNKAELNDLKKKYGDNSYAELVDLSKKLGQEKGKLVAAKKQDSDKLNQISNDTTNSSQKGDSRLATPQEFNAARQSNIEEAANMGAKAIDAYTTNGLGSAMLNKWGAATFLKFIDQWHYDNINPNDNIIKFMNNCNSSNLQVVNDIFLSTEKKLAAVINADVTEVINKTSLNTFKDSDYISVIYSPMLYENAITRDDYSTYKVVDSLKQENIEKLIQTKASNNIVDSTYTQLKNDFNKLNGVGTVNENVVGAYKNLILYTNAKDHIRNKKLRKPVEVVQLYNALMSNENEDKQIGAGGSDFKKLEKDVNVIKKAAANNDQLKNAANAMIDNLAKNVGILSGPFKIK